MARGADLPHRRWRIRETSEEDFGSLVALWNDGRVMRWVGFPDGLGHELHDVEAWHARLRSDPQRHHFVILTEGIGFCGELYYAIDPSGLRAGLDIKLRVEAQGRGIATEALTAFIAKVFADEPRVDALWTEPAPENESARRLYARCGLSPVADDSRWEIRRT